MILFFIVLYCYFNFLDSLTNSNSDEQSTKQMMKQSSSSGIVNDETAINVEQGNSGGIEAEVTGEEGEGEIEPKSSLQNEQSQVPSNDPQEEYTKMLQQMTLWNELFSSNQPAEIALQELRHWTPSPVNGDNNLAFKTPIHTKVMDIMVLIIKLLNIPMVNLVDTTTNTITWSQIRMVSDYNSTLFT